MSKRNPKIVGYGYCENCEDDVDIYEEDCGIGSYEFWGQKGTDTRMGYFCTVCNEEIDGWEPDDPGAEADDAYERRRDERLEEAWDKEHTK